MAPPVTREPIQSASDADAGADIALPFLPPLIPFAADDAE
jgi:hypothetical protein